VAFFMCEKFLKAASTSLPSSIGRQRTNVRFLAHSYAPSICSLYKLLG